MAAFETGLERRDADFHDISRRLSFKIDQQYTQQRSESKDNEPSEPILRVYESDVLFWMVRVNCQLFGTLCSKIMNVRCPCIGRLVPYFRLDYHHKVLSVLLLDLNYRLNLPEDDVRTILRSAARDKSAYSLLLYHDQVYTRRPFHDVDHA